MSARVRELFGLVPVALLVTGGFTAVIIARSDVDTINNLSVTYGLIFLGCCVFAHLFIRARLPDADPYLFLTPRASSTSASLVSSLRRKHISPSRTARRYA